MVGKDIVLTLVEIRGNQIVLGIDAPRSVPIWRSELITADDGTVTPRVSIAGRAS